MGSMQMESSVLDINQCVRHLLTLLRSEETVKTGKRERKRKKKVS